MYAQDKIFTSQELTFQELWCLSQTKQYYNTSFIQNVQILASFSAV